MIPLKGLHYFGGKSAGNPYGVNRWIRSLLPTTYQSTYVETHAGMLGVLLARPKAQCEIANDLNKRVVNWWDILRTRTDEFKHMLRYTPFSQDTFKRARATIDEGTDIERAWKFHVVVDQSMFHADGGSGGWSLTIARRSMVSRESFIERIDQIRDRVIGVQLANMPAVELLERVCDNPDVVAYCDPPYADANTGSYAVVQHDTAAMFDVLRQVRGRVAISGYGSEWDALGWHRSEYATYANLKDGFDKRTEVLWSNFKPEMQEELV